MPWKPRQHRPQPQRTPESRPSARQRGYTSRWERARKAFLSRPENVLCRAEGCNQVATVVDHIVPHKGDYDRFWDAENNWQPLCTYHHNVKTSREGAFGRPPVGGG